MQGQDRTPSPVASPPPYSSETVSQASSSNVHNAVDEHIKELGAKPAAPEVGQGLPLSPSAPPLHELQDAENDDQSTIIQGNWERRHGGSSSYSLPASELRNRRVNLRHHHLPTPSSSASTKHTFTSTPQNPSYSSSTGSSSSASPSSSHFPASASSSSAPKVNTSTADPSSQDGDTKEGMYECNICLDMASSPVVTLCGHLYCWPCIHQWLESRQPTSNTCPVCKAGLEQSKLIPIFSRGRTTDPRTESMPERPSAQRPEPPPRPGGGFFDFQNFGNFQGGAHFGLGPFGLFPAFGMQFNMGPNGFGGINPALNPTQAATVAQQQAFVTRIFLFVLVLTFLSILLY